MGKGFNNYMCKKFFHPASRDNLKRVWMAQQKDDAYRKKQDELRMQYEKEQDLYNNKALLSKESKDKLSVNFMYEPPPGAKKEREKEDNEPEYKFEWQRKYNAPREDYCKGNAEIQDQPFGILVRNVRCIKCRKWGHINTDKECPLYNQATVSEIAQEASDPVSLLRLMREDGLRMKKTALEAQQHIQIPRRKGLVPNNDSDDEVQVTHADFEFLKGLSKKEKLKLLKKIEKLEKRGKKTIKAKKDDKSSESEDRMKTKKRVEPMTDKSSKQRLPSHKESEESDQSDRITAKNGKHKKVTKKADRSSSSEDSSSSPDRSRRRSARKPSLRRSRSRSRSSRSSSRGRSKRKSRHRKRSETTDESSSSSSPERSRRRHRHRSPSSESSSDHKKHQRRVRSKKKYESSSESEDETPPRRRKRFRKKAPRSGKRHRRVKIVPADSGRESSSSDISPQRASHRRSFFEDDDCFIVPTTTLKYDYRRRADGKIPTEPLLIEVTNEFCENKDVVFNVAFNK